MATKGDRQTQVPIGIDKEDHKRITNLGMERAVLACMMNNPNRIPDVTFIVDESDFSNEPNRTLYELMSEMTNEGQTVDLIALLSEIKKKGVSSVIADDENNVAVFLRKVRDTPALVDNLDYYVNEVKTTAFRRKSFFAATEIQNKMLESEDSDIPSLLAYGESKLLSVSMESQSHFGMNKLNYGGSERLAQRASNPVDLIGIPTGFPSLDEAIGGYVRKSLTVLAARTKVGKSVFFLKSALHAAVKLGVPVLLISTEMSDEEDCDRAWSTLSQVPEDNIKNGTFALDDESYNAVDKANRAMDVAPLKHIYMPDFSEEKVMSAIRLFVTRDVGKDYIDGKYKTKDCLVIFDYIKTSGSEENNEEYKVMGHFGSALKNIAGILDIPVVTGQQLNRGGIGEVKLDVLLAATSGSDRITHYCNNYLIMRDKTNNEIAREGRIRGNKKLYVALARSGGNSNKGIDILLKKRTVSMFDCDHMNINEEWN